jgi:hypothetical protein
VLGDRGGQVEALNELGTRLADCAYATGHFEEAIRLLRQVCDVLTPIGTDEAAAIAAEVEAIKSEIPPTARRAAETPVE